MPILLIETNQTIEDNEVDDLLKVASALVTGHLGKSENYVMVQFSHNPNMLFAGTRKPLSWLQLKSIGLSEAATAELSAALCELMESRLKVPRDRTYIEFVAASHKMWGYNGSTF